MTLLAPLFEGGAFSPSPGVPKYLRMESSSFVAALRVESAETSSFAFLLFFEARLPKNPFRAFSGCGSSSGTSSRDPVLLEEIEEDDEEIPSISDVVQLSMRAPAPEELCANMAGIIVEPYGPIEPVRDLAPCNRAV